MVVHVRTSVRVLLSNSNISCGSLSLGAEGIQLGFEWGESFLMGRPVEEILIGWNIFAGYMWPYVLLTYLFSNLIVGVVLRQSKPS